MGSSNNCGAINWIAMRGRNLADCASNSMSNPINSLKRRLARAVSADKPIVQSAPSPQNALDIFAREWASALPEPYSSLRAGNVPLFQDSRIGWAGETLGMKGKSILELG